MINPKELLATYRKGCAYKEGDVLRLRKNIAPAFRPPTYDVIDDTVVVLRQNSLAPHQYEVIGETNNPRTPSDRFAKFEIDGHNWELI